MVEFGAVVDVALAKVAFDDAINAGQGLSPGSEQLSNCQHAGELVDEHHP